MEQRVYVPSRHAPQRLDTPIGIGLAVEQPHSCVFNLLSLSGQIAQCTSTNLLRLQRNPLALPQPPTGPVQAVGSREQLLALLELGIAAFGVIGIAVAKEFGAVRGVGF